MKIQGGYDPSIPKLPRRVPCRISLQEHDHKQLCQLWHSMYGGYRMKDQESEINNGLAFKRFMVYLSLKYDFILDNEPGGSGSGLSMDRPDFTAERWAR